MRTLAPHTPCPLSTDPALLERASAAIGGRLVRVVAPAGSGRTTLLALAASHTTMFCAWCACDAGIVRPADLGAATRAVLAARFPGFATGRALDGGPQAVGRELAEEIAATIPDEVVIVFDDADRLGPGARSALAILIAAAPANIHFALSGERLGDELTAPSPADQSEIGPADLAMPAEQAMIVLRAADPDEREVAIRLRDDYGGWPLGIVLAAMAGETSGRPGEERLAAVRRLVRQTITSADPQRRAFILATGGLGPFTPDLADEATGRRDARRLCDELAQARLLQVNRDPGGRAWFSYHEVVAGVIRAMAVEEARTPVDEGDRVGALLLREGAAERAIDLLLAFGNAAAAADAIADRADQILAADPARMSAWLGALSDPQIDARPELVLAAASLPLRDGDVFTALPELDAAAEHLIEVGAQRLAAIALFRVMQASLVTPGAIAAGVAVVDRHLPQLDADIALVAPLRLLRAGAYGEQHDFAAAREELAAVLADAPADDRALGAWAAVVRAQFVDRPQGRMTAAAAALDGAIHDLLRHPETDVLGMAGFASSARAEILCDLGLCTEALAETARLAEIARHHGSPAASVDAVARLRLRAHLGQGDWDAAGADLAAREITPVHLRLTGEAIALARRGDPDAPRALADAAAAVGAQLAGGAQISALCDLAHAAVAAERMDLARGLASAAWSIAADVGTPWERARAALARARTAAGQGEAEWALTDALRISDEWDLTGVWARRDREAAADLLTRALTAQRGPQGSAARLAAACGGEIYLTCLGATAGASAAVRISLIELAPAVDGLERDALRPLLDDADPEVRRAARAAHDELAAAQRAPLRYTVFGGFDVRRRDVPVSRAALAHDDAARLIAALLSARGPVIRAELEAWLWPRADAGSDPLAAALAAARRALAPEAATDGDTVVTEDGERLELVLAAGDSWDAGELLDAVEAALERPPGEARIEALRAIEASATGEPLPEWAGEEWTRPLRADVRAALVRALERLAEDLMALGEPRHAADRFERLLEMIPAREDWHRSLMRAHAAAGRPAQAIRQYQACRAALRREIDGEPGPETDALYQALLTDAPGATTSVAATA